MTTSIFICANEKTNAGERDYMLALSNSIGTPAKSSACHVFKQAGSISSFDGQIPRTKVDYAALPAISRGALENVLRDPDIKTVNIVGVGNSTLHTTLETMEMLKVRFGNKSFQTHYITHKIDNADDLSALVREDVTVHSTLDREIISGLDAQNAELVNLSYLTAMPHTNTNVSCAREFQALMAQQRAQRTALPGIIDRNEDFAFVVLNAGYTQNGVHVPYTATEAFDHGSALGFTLKPGTHLILADGGPRNAADLAAGHNTRAQFAQGFSDAMEMHGHYGTLIVTLPYDPTLDSPNAVKAGLHMGKMKNCAAFVSNAEGWGTMDGAVRHINNTKRPLVAMPFNAQSDDQTHQANIKKYNNLGVTLFDQHTGAFTVGKQTTPLVNSNGSANIVKALGIKSAAIGKTATPRLSI